MQAFADFILQVTYPPNPIRNLDDTLTPAQQAGRTSSSTRSPTASALQRLPRAQSGGRLLRRRRQSSIEGEPQKFKIPHLRNVYQKVGMFGMPAVAASSSPATTANKGDQMRGFGFLHDGSVDTLFRFLSANAFSHRRRPEAANLEQFVLAFDSNLAPIVGQQVTLTSTNAAAAGPRIDLLIAQAAAATCELVVKGVLAGELRGWLRLAGGTFRSDRAAEAPITDAQLRAQAATRGQELTYTCVPPGSGRASASTATRTGFSTATRSTPAAIPPTRRARRAAARPRPHVDDVGTTTSTASPPSRYSVPIPTTKLTLKDRSTPPGNPKARKVNFKSDTKASTHPGSTSCRRSRVAPTIRVRVGASRSSCTTRSGSGGELVIVGLPAAGWRATGPNTYRFKGGPNDAITRGHLQARPDQRSKAARRAGLTR